LLDDYFSENNNKIAYAGLAETLKTHTNDGCACAKSVSQNKANRIFLCQDRGEVSNQGIANKDFRIFSCFFLFDLQSK